MTIENCKKTNVSLNIDTKDQSAIRKSLLITDLIIDFIYEESQGCGDFNSFIAIYYNDSISDFFVSLLEDSITVEKNMSEYINDCLEEE